MKRIVLAIAVILMSLFVKAQSDTSFHLIRAIEGDIVSFTVDNLDNVYILSSRNQVKKLDQNGDSVAVFNDVKKFGRATLIDVSNPLKILLYYKDFSTVVVLDRFLTVRSIIDLRKQNIFQAKAVGQSYDNKIWVYDEVENKLKKIDEEGKLLMETPDFRLLFGEAINPQKIFDEDKYVYLYDSARAVFVFDYFGTLKNKILITGWKDFKVAGKYIYGSAGDTLYRYEISSFRVDEWNLPPELKGAKSFNFTSDRLFSLKDNELRVYKFQ